LLIEQPDTAKGLESRMQKRFPAARWSHSTAHSSVRSLQRKGWAREVQGARQAAGDSALSSSMAVPASVSLRSDVSALLASTLTLAGPDHSRDAASSKQKTALYEPTAEGLEVFWRWLRVPADEDPLRDEMLLKVAFSRPEHSGLLVDLIKVEEERYDAKWQELHASVALLEDRLADDAFITAQDWPALMAIGLLRDEMGLWDSKRNRRERLREYVESLSAEAARRVEQARAQRRR
jgi:hypothetical protein